MPVVDRLTDKPGPLLRNTLNSYFSGMEKAKKILVLEVVFGLKDIENSEESKKEALKQLNTRGGTEKLLSFFEKNNYIRGEASSSIYTDPIFSEERLTKPEKSTEKSRFFGSDKASTVYAKKIMEAFLRAKDVVTPRLEDSEGTLLTEQDLRDSLRELEATGMPVSSEESGQVLEDDSDVEDSGEEEFWNEDKVCRENPEYLSLWKNDWRQ
jgi:hypothetical protein